MLKLFKRVVVGVFAIIFMTSTFVTVFANESTGWELPEQLS